MSKWISVEDRLPDYEIYVLAYDVECGVEILYRNGTKGIKFLRLGDWCNECEEGCFCEKVTHWMPIPDSPVDSKDE